MFNKRVYFRGFPRGTLWHWNNLNRKVHIQVSWQMKNVIRGIDQFLIQGFRLFVWKSVCIKIRYNCDLKRRFYLRSKRMFSLCNRLILLRNRFVVEKLRHGASNTVSHTVLGNLYQTRMHSSRMRTVRFSGRRGGLASGQEGCLPGGVCPGGCLPGGRGFTPPLLWTEWLTDRCKNITFPQLRLWAVINLFDCKSTCKCK